MLLSIYGELLCVCVNFQALDNVCMSSYYLDSDAS